MCNIRAGQQAAGHIPLQVQVTGSSTTAPPRPAPWLLVDILTLNIYLNQYTLHHT